jgi:hypothetical protein
MKKTIDANTLRAMITRKGGERLSADAILRTPAPGR